MVSSTTGVKPKQYAIETDNFEESVARTSLSAVKRVVLSLQLNISFIILHTFNEGIKIC